MMLIHREGFLISDTAVIGFPELAYDPFRHCLVRQTKRRRRWPWILLGLVLWATPSSGQHWERYVNNTKYDEANACRMTAWAAQIPWDQTSPTCGVNFFGLTVSPLSPWDTCWTWWMPTAQYTTANHGYDAQDSTYLEAQTIGAGAQRSVRHVASFRDFTGGGTVRMRGFQQIPLGTFAAPVLLYDHTIVKHEGKCDSDIETDGRVVSKPGFCEVHWASPVLSNYTGPLTALTTVTAQQTGPGVDESPFNWYWGAQVSQEQVTNQWTIATCHAGGCAICPARAPATPWIWLSLLGALALVFRRRWVLISLLLLLPAMGHAVSPRVTLGLPSILDGGSAGTAQGAPTPETFDLLPYQIVAQGEPVEGGCRLPRLHIDAGSLHSLRLYVDNTTCRVTVGEFNELPLPADLRDGTSDGGTSAGASGDRWCWRPILARTQVTLLFNVGSILADYFGLETRVSRVSSTYTILDDGQPCPCSCTWAATPISSMTSLGWRPVPNALTVPDIVQDMSGRGAGQGACLLMRGSAFEFFGDIHLIGMNPGFRHGLIAGCEQAQQGYYACGFDVDGTLPNVWVKLGWPLLPLTDFAFFTGIDAYWAISHYSAFGTACPAEWIKPPVIW